MAKGKMPPQLLEYFKNKNKKKEDGSGEKMSDKEKRKEALDKAKDAKSKNTLWPISKLCPVPNVTVQVVLIAEYVAVGGVPASIVCKTLFVYLKNISST